MTTHKKYSLPSRINIQKREVSKEISQFIDQNQTQNNKLVGQQDDIEKINRKKQLMSIRLSLDIKKIKNNLSLVKSDYSIGRKTMYKQKILQQKKSYNFLTKKKVRSYSIDESFSSLKKKDIPLQEHQNKTNRPRLVNVEDIMSTFLNECNKIEAQYVLNCQKAKYNLAFQNLSILLNYSIDISSQAWFFKILFGMCQFYEILQVYKYALKLYNQMKEAALLKKNYQYLTISLIGISKCASKSKLQNEAIFILKKALQYAWFIDSTELQLNIYDQLGQRYYKMGEIEKASVYHKKYANSIIQQKDSPLKALSRQQIQLQQQKNLSHNYQNLSPLLLAHLNLPITNTQQLSPLIPNLFTSRSKLTLKTLKLELQTYQIDYQISRLLKTWLFQVQTSQPNIENTKNNLNQSFYHSRKFAYLDFKLNYHLKMKGINYSNPRNHFKNNARNKQQVRKKQTLDQQIKRLVEDPGLQKEWYQNMVKRVQFDHKRKMNHINDPVRINKSALSVKTKLQNLKSLFKQIIQLSRITKVDGYKIKKMSNN